MTRILEISRIPLFKYCFPDETTWFKTGASLIAGDEGCQPEKFSLGRLFRLWLEVRRGGYDLILLPAVDMQYGSDSTRRKLWLRKALQRAARHSFATSALTVMFRPQRNVFVFEDIMDPPRMCYEVCDLAPDFLCYFKREFVPGVTLLDDPNREQANRKVVPWSLFLPTAQIASARSAKTVDIFFSGHTHNRVRAEGIRQINALRERGLRVDVPTERLAYPEYMQRMAAAWLVWSPEGLGWDCYRHYEACFAGAVPVINRPSPPRDVPLRGGEHCLYYDVEGDDLTRVIEEAIAAKERLRTISEQGRREVQQNYTRSAMVARMQRTIVARLRAEGRVSTLPEHWGL